MPKALSSRSLVKLLLLVILRLMPRDLSQFFRECGLIIRDISDIGEIGLTETDTLIADRPDISAISLGTPG